QLRLLVDVVRQVDEGAREVVRRERVGLDRGALAAGGDEQVVRDRVDLPGRLETPVVLEPVDRYLGVLAPPSVQDAGREVRPVQEDLDVEDGRAAAGLADREAG